MSNSGNRNSGAHVLLLPVHTSGHFIPMLDLVTQLLLRGLNITVLVTPTTDPVLLDSIQSQASATGSNSLQTLVLSAPRPLVLSVVGHVRASAELRRPISEWFQSHPSPPVAIISDFFLGWTEKLASELGIPRIAFWATGALPSLVGHSLMKNSFDLINAGDQDPLFSFPNIPNSPRYPHRQIADFTHYFKKDDFIRESLLLNYQSWGAVFNSFTELEGIYVDAVKKEMGHDRVWSLGPLLPPQDDDRSGVFKRGGSSAVQPHQVLSWLDAKTADSVVYVSFGSRTILTSEKLKALATGLELSGVEFIWCLKAAECDLIPDGFEDRVADRGFLIKGWAPQVAILRHPAVCAFLSHCGWNSSIEGIANGVMILTWPFDAEQFINAGLLVDELGVAVRACDCDGAGNQIVPDSSKLAQILAQSVRSDHPKRDRVRKLSDSAAKAVQDQGSSGKDFDSLVEQLNKLKS